MPYQILSVISLSIQPLAEKVKAQPYFLKLNQENFKMNGQWCQ
jgi:hypothetical protein